MIEKTSLDNCSRIIRVITLGLIVWFLTLSLFHYTNQRPMWNDEQCVFQSIEAYDVKQMFGEPLLALQVFPRAYLFTIQQFSKQFDFHILSLRFPAFLFMISAFLMWLRIARKEFKEPLAFMLFVLCWCASVKLIYYSAELKQYALDTFLASCYFMFLYHQQALMRDNPRRYFIILGLLPIAGLFSYPAFILMPIVIWNLLRATFEDKKNLQYLIWFVFVFLCVLATSYTFDMRLRPKSLLLREWGDYFVRFDTVGEFFHSAGSGIRNLFIRWFVEKPRMLKRLSVFPAVIGLFTMFVIFCKNIKKERFYISSLNTIALAVFMCLFTLGCMKKYPFTVPRTSLFFAPVVMFIIVKGITSLKSFNKYLYLLVLIYFIGFLVFVSLGIANALIIEGDMGAMEMLWENLGVFSSK